MPRSYVRANGERRPLPADKSQRFYQPQFYDPYFFIQGSEPEKMVMKELVRRGIYFEHTPQTNDIQWGWLKKVASSDPTTWEGDFLFPQWKIWLEVQGTYFHTLPGKAYKEGLRFAIIEEAGWRPIYWWDYDIIARLPELMDSVPEFYRPPTGKGGFAARDKGEIPPAGTKAGRGHSPWHALKDRHGQSSYYGTHHNRPRTFGRTNNGLPFYEGGTGVDHLKGLRTANSNRATTPQYNSRVRNTRRGKISKKYGHG